MLLVTGEHGVREVTYKENEMITTEMLFLMMAGSFIAGLACGYLAFAPIGGG